MDLVREIGELVRQPTKREAVYRKMRDEIGADIDAHRTLCPSRHAVRASSFQSVIDNWGALCQLWEELLNVDLAAGVR